IRSLVEILSFAKLGDVTDEKLFFRSVGEDRIGKLYRQAMVGQATSPRVKAGFLVQDGRNWQIQPAKYAKVHHDEIRRVFPNFASFVGSGGSPDRPAVTAATDQAGRVTNLRPGGNSVLVVTGDIPVKKKHEFVFTKVSGNRVTIPESVKERFLSRDQLTQWQEDHFGKELHNGEPVFYIEDGRLKDAQTNPCGLFFGRAGMFRLPYDVTPRNLIPPHLRCGGLDLAEALFGAVPTSRDETKGAIRGRLQFGDLLCDSNVGLTSGSVLLSSPKPTAYTHYLTQSGEGGKDALTSYFHDQTTIRGTKLYWHVQDGRPRQENEKTSQITPMNGIVPRGVQFKGTVRFHNLNSVELGALLTAIQLPAGHAHHIGMAKSMGYGSVRLTAALRLTKPDIRYQDWEASGEVSGDADAYTAAFASAILGHARQTNEAWLEGNTDLRQIARLDALYHMLAFPGPLASATMPMDLLSFKKRWVLPSPHRVVGKSEPAWPGPPSRPLVHASGAPRAATAAPRSLPVAARPQPPGPRVEQTFANWSLVECTALDEFNKKGKRLFALGSSNVKGYVVDESSLPPDLVPGYRLTL